MFNTEISSDMILLGKFLEGDRTSPWVHYVNVDIIKTQWAEILIEVLIEASRDPKEIQTRVYVCAPLSDQSNMATGLWVASFKLLFFPCCLSHFILPNSLPRLSAPLSDNSYHLARVKASVLPLRHEKPAVAYFLKHCSLGATMWLSSWGHPERKHWLPYSTYTLQALY